MSAHCCGWPSHGTSCQETMRRNHSSLALCLASSAVLSIPVKVTEAEPGLFILLADPPGVKSSILHSHFWFAKGKWPAL